MNLKNTRPQTERIVSKIWMPNGVEITLPEERIACWLKGQRQYITEDMLGVYEMRRQSNTAR